MKKNFEILGLTPNASEAEIKKTYRTLANMYHPDNKETGNEEKFKEISVAYKEVMQYINNNSKTSSYSEKNELNYYMQKSKLNKQRETANKQKDKYDKDLRITEAEIAGDNILRNNYTSNIKIYIREIISSIENYYSRQIGLNNASKMNRIFEKRRLTNQEKILEQENLYLTPLKELEEKIKKFIEEKRDEEIFKLKLTEDIIAFLKTICSKELEELLNAIKTYQEKYAELKNSLDETAQKKEEIQEKLKKVKSTIASIDEYLRQIDEYYRNDPIREFMDKIDFEYYESTSKSR